jgi:hypothetical protein
MEMVAAAVAVVLTAVLVVVVGVALVPWLRNVLRDEDGGAASTEPSPVDLRTLPYVLLTAVSVAAVRELRGADWSWTDAVLPAALLGFAVSSAWYLRRRRDPEAWSHWPLAALAAVVLGTAWGLAPA